jgi:5'-nucleotidase
MIILLTNDDGIESEGLQVLAAKLRKEHDVWISAPDSNRSASSHAITIHRNVVFTKVGASRGDRYGGDGAGDGDGDGGQSFSCSGTPADCVLYALGGAIPVKPEVVISGINIGCNIGRDIIYSGTVAAARESAIYGIPSIAVSAAAEVSALSTRPVPIQEAADFIVRELETLVSLWIPHTVLNINIPVHPSGTWETAQLSNLEYGNVLKIVSQGDTTAVYALGSVLERVGEAHHQSDFEKLKKGIITISPIKVYPACDEDHLRTLDAYVLQRSSDKQDMKM